MSLAALVRGMAAAGAPPEAIALAVEAVEAEQIKLTERRAKAAKRKADERAKARQSRDSHATGARQSDDTGTTPSQDKSFPDTPSKTQPSNPPLKGSPRGSRLADDFEMPEDWKAWAAAERRWSAAEVDAEAASFTDFWRAKAGKDGRKVDWQATWRNWVRNSRRPNGTATSTRKLSPAEQIDHLERSAALFDQLHKADDAADCRRRAAALRNPRERSTGPPQSIGAAVNRVIKQAGIQGHVG